MRHEILLLGLLVGCVNFLFRYLPLHIRVGRPNPIKRGFTGILLDTIGIASICSLLVVSCVPEIIHDGRRLLPTLVGFAVLGLSFWRTHSIILPTLLSALAYGIAWKLLTDV